MIKPGRTTNFFARNLYRFLHIEIFLLILICFSTLILTNKYSGKREKLWIYTGNHWNEVSRPFSNDSARKFFLIIEKLTKYGYVRCDHFLKDPACDFKENQALPYQITEFRYPRDKNIIPVPDKNKRPYHNLKRLEVSTGDKKSGYFGIINYNALDPEFNMNLLLDFIGKSRSCEYSRFRSWNFIEDTSLVKIIHENMTFKMQNVSKKIPFLNIYKIDSNNLVTEEDALKDQIIRIAKTKTHDIESADKVWRYLFCHENKNNGL